MSATVTESLAAVLSGRRTIEVRPVAAGPLPAAGAWLEVEACGICGSDWSWYAEREITAPFVPGHEIVGRIVAAWGDHGNAAFQPGARVALEEALPCWSCGECRSGRHRLCTRSTRYGGTALGMAPGLWGGFSRYTYLAPRTSAHAVPESIDTDLATLFIPVSNGLSWVRAAGRLQPGESVVVLGQLPAQPAGGGLGPDEDEETAGGHGLGLGPGTGLVGGQLQTLQVALAVQRRHLGPGQDADVGHAVDLIT